MNIISC